MRRIPMMLVALVPLAGLAAEGGDLKSKMNVEKLQKDVKASDILGTQVQGPDGQEAGDVEDIVVGKNGRIEAVLVSTGNQMFGGNGNQNSQGGGNGNQSDQGRGDNQDATQQRASQNSGGQATVGKPTDEEGVRKVRWSQVNYDPSQDRLSVTSKSSGSSGQQQEASTSRVSAGQQSSSGSGAKGESQQSGGQQGMSSFRVSEINGMEVHLEDAKSFGSVEDVLVDPREGKATALLVDAWEGLDKQTYTLPVEIEAINSENDSIDYRYTESEVIALQEYGDQ